MSTLYVPLFLAAVGIIFRGAAFAVRGEAATIAEARALGATFALSSVLVPFFFGATCRRDRLRPGARAAGRRRPDRRAGPNPTSIYVGVLAVATGAYLAAVFLAADAVRAGLPDLVAAFRARALGAAARRRARSRSAASSSSARTPRTLYDGLTSGAGLGAGDRLGASPGLVTLALLWRGRFGPARLTSAVAVGAVIVGLALAQRPDFLPGVLTFDQAAAGDADADRRCSSASVIAARDPDPVADPALPAHPAGHPRHRVPPDRRRRPAGAGRR